MTTSSTSFTHQGNRALTWTSSQYIKPTSTLGWVESGTVTVTSGGTTYPPGSYAPLSNQTFSITVGAGGSATVTEVITDPPLAPLLGGPQANQWIDLRMPVTFSWTFEPGLDSGTQSGWLLEIIIKNKTWWWNTRDNTWVSKAFTNFTTDTSVTIPPSAWAGIATNGETIAWTVANTESFYNLSGPYAATQSFVAGYVSSASTSSIHAVMSASNQVTAAVSDTSSDAGSPTQTLATSAAINAASTIGVIANALGKPVGFLISYSTIANPIEFLFDHTIIGSSNSISRVDIQPLESEVITGANVFSYSILSTAIDVENGSMTASSTSTSAVIGRPGTQSNEPLAGQVLSTSSASVSAAIERGLIASAVSDTSSDVVSPQEVATITNVESGGFLPLQRGIGLLGSTPLQQLLLGSVDVTSSTSGVAGFEAVSSAQVSAEVIYFVQATSQSTSSAASALTEVEPPMRISPIVATSSAQVATEAFIQRTITRALSTSYGIVNAAISSYELVTTAGSLSVSWVFGALTADLDIFIVETDVGVGVETQAPPTIKAALLSHFLDSYVVPDVKNWEIENERARHDQALYRYGEYAIFVLMWTVQDFEANLVGRCKTCYVPSEPVSDTWKQPAYFKCPDCLGTSFEGGYKAILVRPSLWEWDEPKLQQDKRGVINTNVATVQTTADFRMQPKDYVIRGDGSRWQIQAMEGTHLDTGFGTQSGIWDATQFTYTNVTREDESSPIYLLPFSEGYIQQAIPQYFSRQPVEFS